MQLYVLGFMFDMKGERVVLIQKQHGPAHLIGKLNGVGGKVEAGEEPRRAMQREFLEETGVLVPLQDMAHYASFCDPKRTYRVFCFRGFSDRVYQVRTMEDEPVRHAPVHRIPECPLAPNLMWLMHLALTRSTTACAIER